MNYPKWWPKTAAIASNVCHHRVVLLQAFKHLFIHPVEAVREVLDKDDKPMEVRGAVYRVNTLSRLAWTHGIFAPLAPRRCKYLAR